MSKNNKTKSYWSMTEGVFNCLIDEERSLAFKKAIENTVRPGDIVVDMGTGSGILAMFAAKAGAKKVYAVENDRNNIFTLKEIFKKNKVNKIIELIEGDVTTVKLPEKVNVIIGEMIATALIEELQIPAMNNILDYAKNGCKVLLSKYDSFLSLVDSPSEYYGLDFPIIRYEYPDLLKLKSVDMSELFLYYSVDFNKKNEINDVNADILVRVNKSGFINGIKLSSQTKFFDQSSIWGTFAYSYPIILPVLKTKVLKGDSFRIRVKYAPTEGFKNLSYSINKEK